MSHGISTIGESVIITGELTAEEDLTVEGRIEGKVELDHNALTVASTGRLNAHVRAKTVMVMGTVTGNITATEAINIRETATLAGDLMAPTIGIAEGASLRGQVDTSSAKTANVRTEETRTRTDIKAPPQPAVA